jgi:23S rRNA (uracil1939-C5)-methyltransferase
MIKAMVEGLGFKGDGHVRTADGIYHVAKVLPGEVVLLEGGRLVGVETPSPERVPPFCAHYDTCGGCKFQHWQANAYGKWKQSRVAAALTAAGLDASVVQPLMDAHGSGRRRVSLHVSKLGDVWRAGFMEQGSHDLVAIDTCPILERSLQNAPNVASRLGAILGPCDVNLTSAENGVDVAVKAERQAVSHRMQALSTVVSDFHLLRLSVNGEVVLQREQPFVRMGKADVPLPVGSFLQATRAGEQALARLVIAGLHKPKHIADLFSGVGTFSFPLAEVSRVTAIDSDKPAIAALQAGVRGARGLRPIVAEARNLFNAPLTHLELAEFDVVVLDPPRAGAESQSRMLAKSNVSQVAYVL